MKKILLILILFTIYPAISYGQFSIKVGATMAKQLHGSSRFSSFGINRKPGILVGMNYTIKSSEYFAISSGLEFSIKGEEEQVNGKLVNSNFNYIELPLNALFTFGKLYINAGPYLAFLMSAKKNSIDQKGDFKTWDAGLNLGMGISFNHFGIGANYGISRSDISNRKTLINSSFFIPSIRNNVVSVYLTYRL